MPFPTTVSKITHRLRHLGCWIKARGSARQFHARRQTATQRRFHLEGLEPRFLLSATDPTPPAPQTALVVAQAGAPDLQVSLFTAPSSGQFGDSMAVSWTVTNVGDVTAPGGFGWYDQLYLSSNAVRDDDDTYITGFQRATELAPGASYTVTQNIPLRGFEYGALHLIIDTGEFLFSDADDSNNVASRPINITAPNVDLQVISHTAPATATAGTTVPYSFTVKNFGTQAASRLYFDAVRLSNDPVLSTDDQFVTQPFAGSVGSLAANDTYEITGGLAIPSQTAAGQRYLIFVADSYGNQGETNDGNNTLAVPITINPSSRATGIDVAVTDFTVPATAGSGSTFQASITLKNFGDTAAPAGWSTEFFLIENGSYRSIGSYESAGLAAGATFTTNVDLTLPADAIVGTNRTLLAIADNDFFNPLPNEYSANNERVTSITITEGSNADLVVDTLIAPATATLGVPFNIDYTVRNAGTGATIPNRTWFDRVYFSTDTTLFNGNDIFLDTFDAPPAGGQLAAGATYTAAKQITLPGGVTGSGFLIFRTDASEDLPETDEGNNLRFVPITIAGPDLSVTALNSPANAVLGQQITFNYTLNNSGTQPLTLDGRERFYLSEDNVFSVDDIFAGTAFHGGETLGAGQSAVQSATLTLPSAPVGNRFLIVVADAFTDVPETNETNNSFAVPITLTGADLTITAITAPPAVTLGGAATIGWTVKNQGNAATNQFWSDAIYLSDDEIFDQNDTYVGGESFGTVPLGINGEFNVSVDLNIPNTKPGNRFLLVVADGFKAQSESNDDNNVLTVPITVNAPELAVTSFTAPSTLILGESFNASWAVQNIAGVPALLTWSDGVYLSTDNVLDANDSLLGAPFANNGENVAAGASYNGQGSFTVNNVASGNYFLIFKTDAFDQVSELNAANNLSVQPVFVGAVDLVVTNVGVPTVIQTGQTLTVTWKDMNEGNAPLTREWFDVVELRNLTTGQFLDAVSLPYNPVTQGNIAAGAVLERTVSFTLPHGYSAVGELEVTIGTDAGAALAERNAAETGETNNAATATVTATLAPYPDLTVGGLTLPPALESGQLVAFQWTTTNSGNLATAGNFVETVVVTNLTTGQIVATAQVPYDAAANGAIAAGASRARQVAIRLPDGPAGVGQIEFSITTDSSFQLAEYNAAETAETNNNASVTAASTLAAYPDLRVTGLTAPAGMSSGQSVTLNWTLSNSGNKLASGSWVDRVVVRNVGSDQVIHIADVAYTGAAIPAGGTTPRSHTFTLPAGLEGSGQLEITVTTDFFSAFAEYNLNGDAEANNAATVTGNSALAPYPDLVVTAITAPGSALDGDDVLVTWMLQNRGTGTLSGSFADHIYLSEDGVLDASDIFLGSFSAALTLAAGNSIQRTESVRIPAEFQGTRRLLVLSDAGNSVFEAHADGTAETNNLLADDQQITVSLKPRPNLTIGTVTAPATAFSGQPASVQWTVTNNGATATTVPVWYDSVFLSVDPVYDNGDLFLGSVPNPAYLEPGDSYANSATFTLPNGVFGQYYFVVRTDSFRNRDLNVSYIGETNENDNAGSGSVTAITLTPPPDLQVTVNAPAQSFSGQPMSVTWTVSNDGTGNTRATTWTDRVFLSRDNVIDGSDLLLADVLHAPRTVRIISNGGASVTESQEGGALAPGESYTETREFTLPIGQSGEFFVLVQTDAGNVVFEHTGELNNLAEDALNVILTPPPDLEVETLSAPANALAGQPLRIDYRVTNFGATGTPNNGWSDAFYLSADATLDGGDLRLGEVSHNGALGTDQGYDGSVTYVLPHGLNGDFYVFAVTDVQNAVFELDNANNATSVPALVRIESRPADLAVLSASMPATAIAGESVLVRWTVANLGTGPTPDSWSDAVFVSPNADLSNATALASQPRNGKLQPGQSYFASLNVALPLTLSGPLYFFVRTDSGSQVYEEGTAANNVSAPLTATVTQEIRDLEVSNVAATGTVASGGTLTVNWRVTNTGTSTTNAAGWTDYLDLIPAAPGAEPIRLGNVNRNGALAAGASYDATANFTLPIDLQGAYTVRVTADAGNAVFEVGGEDNNSALAASTTTVTLSPVADLVIDSVSAPLEVIGGQPLTVNWTVRNQGAATTAGWSDVFYLSRDPVLNRQSDVYLGFASHAGGLAQNGTYSSQRSFTVPRGLSGTFYLFAVTDSNNSAYERGAEGNNTAQAVATTLVTLAPPADLVAGTITVPANAAAGQQVSITFTVTNNGANAALGSWTDSLYLSQNTSFEVGDLLIGRVQRNGDLASGASYTATLNAPLPGIAPGDYHVILRSDIRNNVTESNEANNLSASIDSAAVTVPALTLGQAVTGLMSAGTSVYYRVEVGAGEALLFTLDASNGDSTNELFVRKDAVPSRAEFDFAFGNASGADQEVIVPFTEAATYYVLAYGITGIATPGSTYSLKAELVPFAVRSVGPEMVGDAGKVTLEIDGARFTPGTSFQLVDPSGAVIPAARTYFEDASNVFATFDLTGRAVGSYDVRAVQPGGQTTQFDDSVTVNVGTGAHISALITGPAKALVDFSHVAYINFTNDGDADAGVPLFIIQNLSGTPISFDPGATEAHPILQIYGAGAGPLGGILRPGESRSIPIHFKVSTPTVSLNLYTVTENDPTPLDFAPLETVLRASQAAKRLSSADVTAALAHLETQLGGTWGGYAAMIQRNAPLLGFDGVGTRDSLPLLELEFRKSVAATGTSLSGELRTLVAGLELGERLLTVRNTATGETFSASALTDGSFVFPRVTPGSYSIEVDGALPTSGTPIEVADGQSLTGWQVGLERGGLVTGAVLATGSSQALERALVRLLRADGTIAGSGVTDEFGRFSIAGLQPGNYQVVAQAEGFARLTGPTVSLASTSDEVNQPLTLQLEAVLQGNVFFAPAGPATSVLRVTVASLSQPGAVFPATISDKNFRIPNLPAGDYALTFEAEGYVTATAQATVATGQTLTLDTVSLALAGAASGVVTSSDPEFTAAYALVALYQGATLIAVDQADAQGAFAFANLQPGNYELQLAPRAAAFSQPVPIQVAAGQDLSGLTVQALPGGKLEGLVRNAAGQALADVEVFLADASGRVAGTFSDHEGRYFFTGLDLGSYTAFVRVGGSGTQAVTVTSLEGTPVTADFNVAVAAQLRGRLLDSAGQPLGEGSVSLYSETGELVAVAGVDAEGDFAFLLQRAGTFSLLGSTGAGSFQFLGGITVSAGANVIRNLTLGTSQAQITVNLPGGAPAAGASVLLQQVLPGGIDVATAGFTAANASGQASFANLAPGNYRVSASTDGNLLGSATFTITGAAAAATVTLAQGYALSGTVTGPGAAPIAGAQVFAVTSQGSIVSSKTTDADGQYAFATLTAGSYEVVVLADGFAAFKSASAALTTDAVQDAALIASTTTLQGVARTAGNQPVIGARVSVFTAAGQLVGVSSTQIDGSFLLNTASGSGLRVVIEAVGYAAAQVANINVPAGSSTTLPAVQLLGAALGSTGLAAAALLAPAEALLFAPQQSDAPSGVGFLDTVKALLKTFQKDEDHISFGMVPEPCEGEGQDCLGERIRLLDAIGFQNQAFDLVGERQSVVRLQGFLTGGIGALSVLDLAGQLAGAVLAVAGPLGTGLSVASDKIRDTSRLARYADKLGDAGTQVTGFANQLQGTAKLANDIAAAVGAFKSLIEIGAKVKTGFFEVFESPDPETAFGKAQAQVSLLNGMLGAASALNQVVGELDARTFASLGEATAEVGNAFGIVGAGGAILGLVGTVTDAIDKWGTFTSSLGELNDAVQAFKDAKEYYESKVDRANLALDTYLACLRDGGCEPEDPRDDDDGGPGPGDPGGPGGPGGYPGPGSPGGSPYNPPVVRPNDPNDILGPQGFGEENWVNGRDPLAFTIRYENRPDATAPAQEVFITQQLDADLDWRTFRLGDFGFGDVRVELPGTQSFYQGRVDLSASKGFFVDVTAFIDVQTGLASWTFTTIDPATGEKPLDPTIGFLPPDVPNGAGDGFTEYAIRPLRTAETGARVDSEATIVFDIYEPIKTPAIFHTLDNAKPTSSIVAPGATSGNADFTVAWTSDDGAGSGVANVDVFVSDNGGPATLWLERTELKSSIYRGETGHTYTFYTLARDNSGNTQLPNGATLVSTLVTGLGNTAPLAEADRSLLLNEGAGTTPLAITAPTDTDNDGLFAIVNTVPDAAKGVIRRADNTVVKAGSLLTIAQLAALVFEPAGPRVNGDAGAFSYTVNDGNGGADTQTIALAITPVNDVPVVDADKTVTALEDGAAVPLAIGAPTDADDDPLTITVTAVPDALKGAIKRADNSVVANGATLTLAQLAALTFTPLADASGGAGTFAYSVSDGNGGSVTQTITLEITAANDAPVIDADKTVRAVGATPLEIVAPTDVDGDTLTITVTAIPDAAKGEVRLASGAAVALNASLTAAQLTGLVFVPAEGFTGAAGSFAYEVSDATVQATQTITLVAVPAVKIDKSKAFVFTDASGDLVTIALKGNGSAQASFVGDVLNNADLDTLLLTGTDATTTLAITVKKGLTTTVAHILTASAEQGLKSVTLSAGVTLGDGVADSTPELRIGGGVKEVKLDDVAANARLLIGSDFDPAAADDAADILALNPKLTLGDVLGAGVELDVRGGLKAVAIGSWAFDGTLRTLQSIDTLKIAGSFGADLLLDADGISAGVADLKKFAIAAGSLTSGTVDIEGALGSLAVANKKAGGAVTLIDGVTLHAASIGKISLTLGGLDTLTAGTGIANSFFTSAAGIGDLAIGLTSKGAAAALVGIVNSSFTAATSLGKVTVSLKGAAASAAGIKADGADVEFQAGAGIGAVKVTVGGATASNIALATDVASRIRFTAGASVGDITLTITPAKNSTGPNFAGSGLEVFAAGAVGKITATGDATQQQLTDVQVRAGKKIGAIKVAAKTAGFGSITDGTFIAGVEAVLQTKKDLTETGIAGLTVSGSLTRATFAAKGNIGKITVGGDAADSRFIAGIDGGADADLLTADAAFNAHGSIAGVKITGALRATSIIAGIDPGSDLSWGQGVGTAADTAGEFLSPLLNRSTIGALAFGSSTILAGLTDPLRNPATQDHLNAIESLGLKSLAIGKLKAFKVFTAFAWLDADGDGLEEASETRVAQIS